MPANLENLAVAAGLEKVSFHSNPKEGQLPKNVQTTTQLHSFHMLARLCAKSSSMNQELPDVQAGYRKGRQTRDQIASICWILVKAREFQRNVCLCFIDCAKAFDFVDHSKLWETL